MLKINDRDDLDRLNRDETEPVKLLVGELMYPPDSYDGPTFAIAEITASFMQQVRAAQLAVLSIPARGVHLYGSFYWGGGEADQEIDHEYVVVEQDEFCLIGHAPYLDDATMVETDLYPLDELERWFASDEPVLYLARDPDALRKEADAMVTAVSGPLWEAGVLSKVVHTNVIRLQSAGVH